MMKIKEVQSLVEMTGLNFKDWKEETIKQGRLAIIDKEGEEYKLWEQDLLERQALKLVLEKSKSMKQIKTTDLNNKSVEQKSIQNKLEV